jgi:hypothetical protein
MFCTSPAFGYPTAKITAKVVNEQGNPISGANVSISFMKAKEKEWGMTTYDKDGKSDNEGLYTTSGEGTQSVSIFITKDGYYPSGDGVKLTSRSFLNRWEPWNPTIEVVLKKKRNPVPMYDNHRTSYKVPKLDTPVGFDLEKEDWVTPYGNGLTADFLITFNAEIRAYTDYDCGFSLKFSNPHDGIQEYFFDAKDQSYFKWPFEAPTSGYLSEISKQKNMLLKTTGYKSDEKNNANYIFRVRTKVDKNGNIVDARYGKISGEFGFVPSGEITFRYFLNPDGTRNLEEDPDRNLFKNKK